MKFRLQASHVALCFNRFFWVGVISAFIPALSLYGASMGWEVEYIALLVSLSTVPGIFMGPVIGRLAEHLTPSVVMGGSGVISSFAFLGVGVVSTPAWTAFFVFLSGIGMASQILHSAIVFSLEGEAKSRSVLISRCNGAGTAGIFIGPLAVLTLSKEFGYLTVFGALCIAGLLGSLSLYFLLREVRLKRKPIDERSGRRRFFLRKDLLLPVTVLVITPAVCFASIQAVLPIWLSAVVGLDNSLIGFIFSFRAVISVVANFFIIVALLKVFPSRYVYVCGSLLMVLVYLAFPFERLYPSLALILLLFAVLTLGYVLWDTLVDTNVAAFLDYDGRLTYNIGLVVALSAGVKALAMPLGGYVYSNYGYGAFFFSVAVLLLLSSAVGYRYVE